MTSVHAIPSIALLEICLSGWDSPSSTVTIISSRILWLGKFLLEYNFNIGESLPREFCFFRTSSISHFGGNELSDRVCLCFCIFISVMSVLLSLFPLCLFICYICAFVSISAMSGIIFSLYPCYVSAFVCLSVYLYIWDFVCLSLLCLCFCLFIHHVCAFLSLSLLHLGFCLFISVVWDFVCLSLLCLCISAMCVLLYLYLCYVWDYFLSLSLLNLCFCLFICYIWDFVCLSLLCLEFCLFISVMSVLSSVYLCDFVSLSLLCLCF